MIYQLTDEQIAEIIKFYGGDEHLLIKIERLLNIGGLVRNENDFYEIVVNVVSQIETFKLKQSLDPFYNEAKTYNLEEIIEQEINRYYDFEEIEESYAYFYSMDN